jgi:hypothetical protein
MMGEGRRTVKSVFAKDSTNNIIKISSFKHLYYCQVLIQMHRHIVTCAALLSGAEKEKVIVNPMHTTHYNFSTRWKTGISETQF